MIKINKFTKSIKNKQLFNNVSFSIDKSTLLLGANGTGKTTLIKAIVGTDSKYEGAIELSCDKKNISYAPQSDVLIEQFRVIDMINYPCWLNNINISKEELNTKLNEYNLQLKKKTIISDLSGGEKKKLCILLCFIKEAELYILDEPTNNLDNDSREMLKKDAEQKNVLIVSHDDKILDINFKEVIVLSNNKIHKFTKIPIFYEYYLKDIEQLQTLKHWKKELFFAENKYISKNKLSDENLILIGKKTSVNYIILYAQFLKEQENEKITTSV